MDARALPRLEQVQVSTGWMARALGVLYVCGGSLALVWTLIPHDESGHDGVVAAMALLAVSLGSLLALGPVAWLPRWSLHVVIAVIQVVISVGYLAGGPASNDIRLFYAWATPYAAFFFGRRAAWAHAAWTGLNLALSLTLTGATWATALSVWLMTMGTVGAVGLLVGHVAQRMRVAQARLHTAALHDPLTGLLNRRGFADALDDALVDRAAHGGDVLVLLIDLDHFKLVNDSHGHHVGDQMLMTVAPRLAAALGPGDVVARMGGDEFAVVCRDRDGDRDLGDLLQSLRGAWREPAVLDAGVVPVSGSFGIVRSGDGATAESLLRDADVALYRAKEQQRGSAVVHDASLRAMVDREAAVDRALRFAVERDELALHFQPVIDVDTVEVVGAEALLRWTSRELGVVPPGEFVPIAEDRGLIGEIGRWALDECCRIVAGWRERGEVLPTFRVALNVSGRQLEPGFVDEVRAARERYDLPPETICVEITESVLLGDTAHVAECLAALDDAGTALLLDDFGTGFSSLSYLHRYPLTAIKIDRSFVQAIATSARQRALVDGMLTMARALGLRVVAEGVETEDVAAVLRDLGCLRAQGYLWSRPVPAADFPAVYAARQVSPTP